MFDTIILLTGPVEEAVLASVLRKHNPALDIRSVKSQAELEALAPDVLARARLIAFVTPVIVPTRILDALGYGAYNFHPGPPHYPGWVPSHFAVYDGATDFGVTAHVMHERVDSGPIVGVARFDVPPKATVEGLERMALVALARLFWNFAHLLAQPEPLVSLDIAWSGRRTTRRNYAALCEISAGLTPTITLHGRQFRYVADAPSIIPSLVPEQAPAEPARATAAATSP
jgi:methionyl-tRNA formyltransferase